MSSYRTARGKVVSFGGITLDVDNNGDLVILIGDSQRLALNEATASELYDLLGDVMEWKSNEHATEAQLGKMFEKEGAEIDSGKLDDVRSAKSR